MHDCSGKFKITSLSFGRHARALTVFFFFFFGCIGFSQTISYADTSVLQSDLS